MNSVTRSAKRPAQSVLRAAVAVLLGAALASASAMPQAPPSNTPPGPNPADVRELYNYTLTLDRIHKLSAVEKDLDNLQKSDPKLRQSLQNDTAATDLDQAAQRLQKYPQAMAILKKDGLTPREYIVGIIVLLNAVIAVGFKKNGAYKDYPPQVQQSLSPVNLAFVEQHWDQISKLMPAISTDAK